MPLSSEVFVMLLFIVGVPLFYIILKDRTIPEHRLFMLVYLQLTFSNIFTVVEEFLFEQLFNTLEHLFIAFAAVTMLTAVIRLSRYGKGWQTIDTTRKNS